MTHGIRKMSSVELLTAQTLAGRAGAHATALACHREITRRAVERIGQDVDTLHLAMSA